MQVVLICFASIGLAAFFLQLKENFRFVDFIHFLVFGGVATLFLTEAGQYDVGVVLSLLGVVAANYVVAQVKFMRKDYLRAVVPLISLIIYAFLLRGRITNFMEEESLVINKFLVVGGIIAAISHELIKMKIVILNKLFGDVEEKDMMKALQLLFVGIALFMGMFQSGAIGLLIITAIHLSSSFYRNEEEKGGASVSLMTLAAIPFLLFCSEEMSVELLSGDVLEGIFFGAFSLYFIKKLWYAKQRKTAMIVLGYLLVLALSFGLLFLYTMYANMGGMDAFIGLLVGFAITQALVGKGYVGAGLLSFLLIGGIALPSFMVNEEQADFESLVTTEIVDKNGDVAKPVILPLGEISGSYAIVNDASRISFTLGEKGETKGAFKQVGGTVVITDEVENSKFDIQLEMTNFTTFNKYRDESLLSDEYFDAEKFPKMVYSGNKLVEKGENTWEIQGKFTMLGITKDVNVSVKRLELGDKKVLIGSGEIDRTLFGMTPSATEGNVVSFDFQIELK